MLVRINTGIQHRGIEQLTPGSALEWGDIRFELNPVHAGHADFSIVLYTGRPRDDFKCAPQNTLFLAGEPLEKKLYPKAYYRQFGHVHDTHEQSGHPNLRIGPPALNWHVGLDMSERRYRYGYDHLSSLPYPEKINKVAVVCSNASFTPGQRARLRLLDALKVLLPDAIVHFGKGFHPIDDKMEAILPYRYHLVLENCQAPHYWSEKLADAYLGWAYPIYLGSPNLAEYFPEDAYTPIDFQITETVATIKRLLELPPTTAQVEAINLARDLILNRYNPFAWCAKLANELYQPLAARMVTIRSHRAFRPFPRNWIYRLRHGMN